MYGEHSMREDGSRFLMISDNFWCSLMISDDFFAISKKNIKQTAKATVTFTYHKVYANLSENKVSIPSHGMRLESHIPPIQSTAKTKGCRINFGVFVLSFVFFGFTVSIPFPRCQVVFWECSLLSTGFLWRLFLTVFGRVSRDLQLGKTCRWPRAVNEDGICIYDFTSMSHKFNFDFTNGKLGIKLWSCQSNQQPWEWFKAEWQYLFSHAGLHAKTHCPPPKAEWQYLFSQSYRQNICIYLNILNIYIYINILIYIYIYTYIYIYRKVLCKCVFVSWKEEKREGGLGGGLKRG